MKPQPEKRSIYVCIYTHTHTYTFNRTLFIWTNKRCNIMVLVIFVDFAFCSFESGMLMITKTLWWSAAVGAVAVTVVATDTARCCRLLRTACDSSSHVNWMYACARVLCIIFTPRNLVSYLTFSISYSSDFLLSYFSAAIYKTPFSLNYRYERERESERKRESETHANSACFILEMRHAHTRWYTDKQTNNKFNVCINFKLYCPLWEIIFYTRVAYGDRITFLEAVYCRVDIENS